VLGALAACHLVPRPVRGVPAAEPWLVLPLQEWLAEERTEPEAVAMCRPPECAPGLAVGVVRLAGPEADAAEAALRSPEKLGRSLSLPKRAGSPAGTVATAARLKAGPAEGFLLALRRPDGSRPAHGAALGRRSGPDLRVVLVIGREVEAVETTARRVAREHLGASDVVTRLPSL
jgi:hypothetical protein